MSWTPLNSSNVIRRPVCPCCGKVICRSQSTQRIVIQDRGVAALARVRRYRCLKCKQTVKVVVI